MPKPFKTSQDRKEYLRGITKKIHERRKQVMYRFEMHDMSIVIGRIVKRGPASIVVATAVDETVIPRSRIRKTTRITESAHS